ncbi:CcdB family protein [Pararobbsia alpina]|uniref:Toxin CcdB n=1 Tax=Pararobbsia alpina TaxID=621374 RepID=A0A6S7BPK8_9BURK|nr:CcdB family protein [Pararobbsia alpina]CAB3807881.1 hypothetical protein LMG28138_05979 [Pararobbsia alpina]
MERFEVYANTGKTRATTPFLIDVQSDHLEGLTTRVVIPLIRVDAFPPTNLPTDLTPVFEIRGTRCMLHPAFIGAVAVKELGVSVGSLKAQRDQISAALDRLTGGY